MEGEDSSIVFGSQIQTVPTRTCACVCCAEARDTLTSSRIMASARKRLRRKVFLEVIFSDALSGRK
jgi:hypothetical protein